MPQQKSPELIFQKHIEDFLIREHDYSVLEQFDITGVHAARSILLYFKKIG